MTKEVIKRKVVKRLKPAEWAEAKALWESGEFTLTQISEKIGSSREHLSRKFKSEGIEKGSKSKAIEAEVESSVIDEITSGAKLLPQRVAETKERHYKYSVALSKMSMQTLVAAVKEGKTAASVGDDIKAINNLVQLQGRVMEQIYKILGIDEDGFIDEEGLPELPITVLTEVQMNTIRSRATAQISGTGDGLGGILEENDIIDEGEDLEDLDEPGADAALGEIN